MAVMIEPRNDDRIDGLAAQVDGLGGQMREQGQVLREQRQEMTAGFKQVDERFERMYRMMVSASVLIIIALIGAPHL